MSQIDPRAAPIEALQIELGLALDAAIDRQGGKVAFAQRAGLNRATLYRLLRGENVSTEVLLRTLRALGRWDLLAELLAAPAPSPLELRPQERAGRARKRSRKRALARPERLPIMAEVLPVRPRDATSEGGSLVSRLALGRLPPSLQGDDDG